MYARSLFENVQMLVGFVFFFLPACCSSDIPRLPLHCPLELQTCKAAFPRLDPAGCFVFFSLKKQPLEHVSIFSLSQVSYLEVLKKKTNPNFWSFCFLLVETWELLVLLESIDIINGVLLET